MDLDLRKLRYFAEVAGQLHFGVAADRLHITQPVLSRQIRQLERELGVTLFTRSSRRVSLTPAGRQLQEEARALLSAADAAQHRVQDAVHGARRFCVGFMAGVTITPVISDFSAAHPGVDVEVRRTEWYDQAERVLDGTVDVGYARLPITERGLRLHRLYAEPRLAVLPISHPLAGKDQISIADLADDPVIMHRGAIPAWDAFCNINPRPDGSHPRPGPAIRTMDEKLEHVASGRAITFLPASAAAFYVRPDIAYVPVHDIPPHPVCLVSDATRRSPLISAFTRLAQACTPPGTIPAVGPAPATEPLGSCTASARCLTR
ncbi:MAG: LysR substrate-binding domain-containing protein [Actinomycetota bacterium]|nr:LysR substrate-binding domain-containing protein [Actinomycetota bacterium]